MLKNRTGGYSLKAEQREKFQVTVANESGHAFFEASFPNVDARTIMGMKITYDGEQYFGRVVSEVVSDAFSLSTGFEIEALRILRAYEEVQNYALSGKLLTEAIEKVRQAEGSKASDIMIIKTAPAHHASIMADYLENARGLLATLQKQAHALGEK